MFSNQVNSVYTKLFQLIRHFIFNILISDSNSSMVVLYN